MSRTISLPTNLSEQDKKAFQEAKEVVQRLEARHPGDPNRVLAEIKKMTPEIPDKVGFISKDVLYRTRVGEIASAYAKVSDGAGGIAGDAHKISIGKLQNVLSGIQADGHGYSMSQKLAIMAGKAEHIAEGIKGSSIYARVGVAILGAGGAGLAAAAEPNATPASVAKATVHAVAEQAVPGSTQAAKGNLCKAFGEFAGATTEGVVTGATFTSGIVFGASTSWSGVGIAGGAAIAAASPVVGKASGTVAQAGVESGCNLATSAYKSVSQKLAEFRDNASELFDRPDKTIAATVTARPSVSTVPAF